MTPRTGTHSTGSAHRDDATARAPHADARRSIAPLDRRTARARANARVPIPSSRTVARDRVVVHGAHPRAHPPARRRTIREVPTRTAFVLRRRRATARDMSIAARARFKDGTIKHACFAALYAAGAAGLTVRRARARRRRAQARTEP